MFWFSLVACWVLLISTGTRATSQTVLAPAPAAHSSYDEGLFTPVGDLSVLSTDTFTTLKHPLYPRHSVRIKKSHFCDGGVASGGSGALGLFTEFGPCWIKDEENPRLEYNPYGWNANSNIFFIEQPVGAGFSYAEYGESVSTTEEAAKDVAAFITIFFEHFGKFKGRAFHLAGESFGGRYVPLFGAAVYDNNEKLVKAGLTPVNLTSIMIGNGMTDHLSMYQAYYEKSCTSIANFPILDISTCVAMKLALPRCEKWLRESCIDMFDGINCQAAFGFCASAIEAPFMASGINPYDITKKCKMENEADVVNCFAGFEILSKYLNRPSIRAHLGADSASGNWTAASWAVNDAFTNSLDVYRDSHAHVAALLERGVNVLIYAGTNDWICNHLGNEKWTLSLEWTGKEEFGKEGMREWWVDGRAAGMMRSAGGLTFATIYGGSHTAPSDKPKESLELVKRWWAGVDL